MTARANALETLSVLAASPEVAAWSTAHLLACIDALVVVYATADQSRMTARQASIRSNRAAWSTVFSHAENRIRNLKLADAARVAA